MKIEDLWVGLSFKADTTKLKDFINSIGDLNMKTVLGAFGLDRMYEGVKHIMEIGDETAETINNFTTVTGQSAEAFQQWSKFSKQMGMDAGTLGQSLVGLEDELTNIQLGKGAHQGGWQRLGLDPRQFGDPSDPNTEVRLLGGIRGRLKGRPVNQQRELLANLGLSAELLKIINVTDEKYASITEHMINSTSELKKMHEWHDKLTDMTGNWATAWTAVASQMAPVLEFFVSGANGLAKFIDKFGGLLALVAGAGAIFKIIMTIVEMTNPWLKLISIILAALPALGFLYDKIVPNNPSGAGINSSSNSVNNNNVTMHINGNNAQDVGQVVHHTVTKLLRDANTPQPKFAM